MTEKKIFKKLTNFNLPRSQTGQRIIGPRASTTEMRSSQKRLGESQIKVERNLPHSMAITGKTKLIMTLTGTTTIAASTAFKNMNQIPRKFCELNR
mgnify:CR=1 FL=1